MSTTLCRKCGKPKEASRVKSALCRACDGAGKSRAVTGTRTAHRRLTLDLPVDVWDRLDAEARESGQRIAGYLQYLVVKRDTSRHPKTSPDAKS